MYVYNMSHYQVDGNCVIVDGCIMGSGKNGLYFGIMHRASLYVYICKASLYTYLLHNYYIRIRMY